MNNIAISPQILMYALQNQNVERKIAKQIDISFLQNENKTVDDEKNENNENNENIENNIKEYKNIPEILIPNDNNNNLIDILQEMNISGTIINNNNIGTLSGEREQEQFLI
jgi:hypothetical protein